MAELHITKQAAAQRQLDAAIRLLFLGEDLIAVHTLAAAAHNLLSDLDLKSGGMSNVPYLEVMEQLQEQFPSEMRFQTDIREFKNWLQSKNRTGANFLKHADRDAGKSLNVETLTTDHMLLEACSMYRDLKLEPTSEMHVYARWHLAVYPHLPEDRILTEYGEISELSRDQQIEFGSCLLEAMSNRGSGGVPPD